MTREWMPGDVALVTSDDNRWRGIVRPRKAANGELEIVYVTGGFDMVGDLADGYAMRPLVVIDPEGREQVEQIRNHLRDECGWVGMDEDNIVECLQEAIRSLERSAVPKPDEPTGLGAVIEDANGKRWVRSDPDSPAWTQWDASLTRVSYDRIYAVRVLSDGVTP